MPLIKLQFGDLVRNFLARPTSFFNINNVLWNMAKMDIKTEPTIFVGFFWAIIYSYLRKFFIYWNSVNMKSICLLPIFTSWSFSVLLNFILRPLSEWKDCCCLLFVSTDASSIRTNPSRPGLVLMIWVSNLECWWLQIFRLFLKLKGLRGSQHVLMWQMFCQQTWNYTFAISKSTLMKNNFEFILKSFKF